MACCRARFGLNAILGFGQLLSIGELNQSDQESTEQILKAGRHLLQLINEVLDIAGIESGRRTLSMEPVEVVAAAQEALSLVQPLADQREIVLENRIPSDQDPYVLGDYQRLKQVLLNLLSNAVKYNREGGRVILSCEQRQDARLRISVSDTGPGITQENLNRLFIPFERLGAEQTGIEGTGLGLALSKTLVDAMRGSMGVDTVVGQGSTFWFDLGSVDSATAALHPGAQEHRSAPAAETSNAACTLLYIEDTLSNLRLMERILAFRPQVRLLSASCGLDGLELARTESPDLILLDVHLPDILGGEVIRRLRAEPACRDIPIVILSADATKNQIHRLLAAGARAYLTKPLDVEQVLRVVDEAAKTKDFSHAV
ncbi:MAG: response regulator [Acidobacteria bacterium]|nr:response regulator [Acidobacteriota bacterium]